MSQNRQRSRQGRVVTITTENMRGRAVSRPRNIDITADDFCPLDLTDRPAYWPEPTEEEHRVFFLPRRTPAVRRPDYRHEGPTRLRGNHQCFRLRWSDVLSMQDHEHEMFEIRDAINKFDEVNKETTNRTREEIFNRLLELPLNRHYHNNSRRVKLRVKDSRRFHATVGDWISFRRIEIPVLDVMVYLNWYYVYQGHLPIFSVPLECCESFAEYQFEPARRELPPAPRPEPVATAVEVPPRPRDVEERHIRNQIRRAAATGSTNEISVLCARLTRLGRSPSRQRSGSRQPLRPAIVRQQSLSSPSTYLSHPPRNIPPRR
jgi:hypothetical protein